MLIIRLISVFCNINSSHLAELIDISSYGSYMSVIHGTTGEFMVNRTNSLTSVFEQLSGYEGACKFVINFIRFYNIFNVLSFRPNCSIIVQELRFNYSSSFHPIGWGTFLQNSWSQLSRDYGGFSESACGTERLRQCSSNVDRIIRAIPRPIFYFSNKRCWNVQCTHRFRKYRESFEWCILEFLTDF